VDYAGVVWCITVPSGAFVARRNGVAFVTGNSGFPKGKANLKPAHEPIVLARKPGPLRPLGIDECRIPGAVPVTVQGRSQHTYGNGKGFAPEGLQESNPDPAGRWPSNVLLQDAQLFDQPNPYVVGSGATAGGSGPASGPTLTGESTSNSRGKFNGVDETPFYGDSGGYSRFFAIPQRYNGTCVRCGLALTAESPSYRLSPSADSAPSDAAISPDGTPDSTGGESLAPSPNGSESTTDAIETRFWHDGIGTTMQRQRSKRRETSPESTPPSSPAKSPDAESPETGTTTTTPGRSMCATCVEAITSPTTSDSDEQLEPYPRALIIPKADRAERERGLGDRERGQRRTMGGGLTGVSGDRSGRGGEAKPIEAGAALRANVHPTVKPIDLMRHLVRLVTPPGGTILDPFLGSGTTCLAASEEGFRSIGIERELEYLEIAKGRLMATPMGLGLGTEKVRPTHEEEPVQRGRRRGGFGNVGAEKGDPRPNGPMYNDGPRRAKAPKPTADNAALWNDEEPAA
jgi:hypothetical protein